MIHGLEAFPVFGGLTPEQLDVLGHHCEMVTVKQGETVFTAGDPATHLVFVRSGRVELRFQVEYAGATDEFPLDTVGSHGACGWSAMIPPHRYTLGGYAVQDSELVRIKRSDLEECCEADLQLGYLVMKNIARLVGERYELARRILLSEIKTNIRQRDPLA
ncbi:MAG: cyclic nucleotide-binding domain-containing protein [Gemmatimonadota bacterium]|nr:cyclic nucleotide-binding domain-containing protein [Gemmatimonadota bacterium]